MDMTRPSVSVVIATRNRKEYLSRLLESILAQDLRDWETIIADDGSSKETFEGYGEIQQRLDGRFHWMPCTPDAPASGPAAARNRGIRIARGQYIAFCDDDDYWIAPDHLSTAVQVLDRRDGDFLFGNLEGGYDWFPGCERWLCRYPVLENPRVYEVSRADLCATMKRHYPILDTSVVRAEVIQRLGGFWEHVRYNEDMNFMLRLADVAKSIFYRDDKVAHLQVSDHPRINNMLDGLDKDLISAAAFQHALAAVHTREAIGCARALQSWHLHRAAERLLAIGKDGPARILATQSLAVQPSWSGLRTWCKTLV